MPIPRNWTDRECAEYISREFEICQIADPEERKRQLNAHNALLTADDYWQISTYASRLIAGDDAA